MVDKTNKTNETFVYEGKEWTLTGRLAKKAVFHKRDVNRQVGTMTIVEIASTALGGSDPTFNKWVDPRELFYISEVEEVNVDSLKKDNDEVEPEDE